MSLWCANTITTINTLVNKQNKPQAKITSNLRNGSRETAFSAASGALASEFNYTTRGHDAEESDDHNTYAPHKRFAVVVRGHNARGVACHGHRSNGHVTRRHPTPHTHAVNNAATLDRIHLQFARTTIGRQIPVQTRVSVLNNSGGDGVAYHVRMLPC